MAKTLSNNETEVNLLLLANLPYDEIATTLNRSYLSIKNTASRIRKKKSLGEALEGRKRGRKSVLNPRIKRAIKRDIIRSPKEQNSRILLENDLSISRSTLQRQLKEEGFTINIASKKAYISKKAASTRLKYAKEMLKKKDIDLRKVIFSDESAIQRGHGSRPEYYRKLTKIRAGRQLVSTTNKSMFY